MENRGLKKAKSTLPYSKAGALKTEDVMSADRSGFFTSFASKKSIQQELVSHSKRRRPAENQSKPKDAYPPRGVRETIALLL